jgi:hypothetical protein
MFLLLAMAGQKVLYASGGNAQAVTIATVKEIAYCMQPDPIKMRPATWSDADCPIQYALEESP